MVGARSHGEHVDDIGETAGSHRIATREILGQEESTGKLKRKRPFTMQQEAS